MRWYAVIDTRCFPTGTSTRLGELPDPANLPPIQTFTPSIGPPSGLDLLAAAATGDPPPPTESTNLPATLHDTGPYNPAASLPPKVVKRVLALDFVEMSELRGDICSDDTTTSDTSSSAHRTGKPPVKDIKVWLECYARMAALLTMRFPEKAPELCAYQTTIMNAAYNYEGSNWVAYDRQFLRDRLARRDLNWSVPNSRLYSEAFVHGPRSCDPALPALPLRGSRGGELSSQPQPGHVELDPRSESGSMGCTTAGRSHVLTNANRQTYGDPRGVS